LNLNAVVGPYVATVNPWTTVVILPSAGYTTNSDGTRVPTYGSPVTMQAQVQSLTYNDTFQLDGLNLNGERRAIYLNGNWDSVARPDQTGGDLVTFPDGSVWLVVLVLENWSDESGWVKLACTRQLNP
jgi:hypothetical protein